MTAGQEIAVVVLGTLIMLCWTMAGVETWRIRRAIRRQRIPLGRPFHLSVGQRAKTQAVPK